MVPLLIYKSFQRFQALLFKIDQVFEVKPDDQEFYKPLSQDSAYHKVL